MSFKKVDKIFYHAMERKKDSVLEEIILKFPQYHEGKGTCFSCWLFNYYREYLEKAFQLGLHPDSGTSFLCLVHDHPEIVKLGIKYGADLEKTNWDNEVPLGYATAWGNFESVRILVEAGANVNAIEGIDVKTTPLDCSWDKPEIKEYLRQHGAKYYKELFPEEVPEETK